MSDAPNYPITSVDNALRLLGCFAHGHSVRVADAGRELGVARSTAHRLLGMLEAHGYAVQDPVTRAYLPGPALTELGLAVMKRDLDIRAVARPVIEELVALTGESGHLVVLSGSEMLIIDSVESPQMLHVGTRIGTTAPAFASAGGRVMLAQLSDGALERLYPNDDLGTDPQGRTHTRSELVTELEQIRQQGFWVSTGEVEAEITTIAAAIETRPGSPCVAITVSAPTFRLAAPQLIEFGDAIRAAARQCSRR